MNCQNMKSYCFFVAGIFSGNNEVSDFKNSAASELFYFFCRNIFLMKIVIKLFEYFSETFDWVEEVFRRLSAQVIEDFAGI